MSEAFENVRNGHGPVFLEFSTYRWREHCGPITTMNLAIEMSKI